MERKHWTREGVLNFALDMADAAETDTADGVIEWARNQDQDIKSIIEGEREAQRRAIARAKFKIAQRSETPQIAASISVDDSLGGAVPMTLLEANEILDRKGHLYIEAARLRTAETDEDRIALARDILTLESRDAEQDG